MTVQNFTYTRNFAFLSLGSERAKGKRVGGTLRALLGGVQCSRMERKRI